MSMDRPSPAPRALATDNSQPDGAGVEVRWVEASPAPLGPRLQDLILPLVFGPLIAAALWAIGSAIVLLLERPWVVRWIAAAFPVALFAALVALVYSARRAAERRHEARAASWSDRPVEEVAREAVPRLIDLRILPRMMIRAAQHLYETRGLRCALIVGRVPSLGEVRPIPHAFEPRPLDETDASFAALRDAHQQPSGNAARAAPDRRTNRPRMISPIPRPWMRRHVPVIVCLLVAALIVVDVLRSGLSSDRIVALIAAGVVVAMFTLLPWLVNPRTGGLAWIRGRWMLIPAGLLVLEPSGSTYRPHILRAADSLLLAREIGGLFPLWLVLVRDGARMTTGRLTPTELRMLLAAWLSPLEPPKPEQLSDLTGHDDACQR